MDFKLDLNVLRKQSIMVCTPMYGGVCEGSYAKSILAFGIECAKLGIHFEFETLFNESLITRARAYSCDAFLRSKCTNMIFIDSDIGFNPGDIFILLYLQATNPNYDVIGAPYSKKCISWEKIKLAVEKGFAKDDPNNLKHFVGDYVFNPKQGIESFSVNEPVEVSELGTGFMMIKRETLLKYKEAYPDLSYKPDHIRSQDFDGSREIHMFFDTAIDPVSKRYLSEDYKFCQDVIKMGGHVWMCPWMGLSHSGKYSFGEVGGGGLHAMAAIGTSATADPELLKGTKKPLHNNEVKDILKAPDLTPATKPIALPGLPGNPIK